MKTKIAFILILLLAVLIFVLPFQSPPSFNADEAAFGYNAYSILKTGKDEYGNFLPARFKSFGDYKLPLYSYLSVPVIAVFGLTQSSVRLVAHLSGLLLIIMVFFLTYELFKNKTVALIAMLLAAVSPWIHLLANHAHEATLATLLIAFSVYFLLKFINTKDRLWSAWSLVFASLSLYAYHTAKVVFVALLLINLYLLFKAKKEKIKLLGKRTTSLVFIFFLILITMFVVQEIQTPARRIQNLLIVNHSDISLKSNEAKLESRFTPFQNHAFIIGKEVANRYLAYFSPEFLVIQGDENPRFGYENISLITYLEFIFLIAGVFLIVKQKRRKDQLFLLLLLIVPLASALSWQTYSYTRVHPMIIFLLPIASYGFYSLLHKKRWLLFSGIFFTLALSFTSLYFYYFHYPKRDLVIRTWQAGYQQLAQHIQKNYSQYDAFYITRKNGQPYIMLLYYLHYPPEKYQAQAKLSAPDEYGFGQVENFDKFHFNFQKPKSGQSALLIGYPDDFNDFNNLDPNKLQKIIVGTEEMFWLYPIKQKSD